MSPSAFRSVTADLKGWRSGLKPTRDASPARPHQLVIEFRAPASDRPSAPPSLISNSDKLSSPAIAQIVTTATAERYRGINRPEVDPEVPDQGAVRRDDSRPLRRSIS